MPEEELDRKLHQLFSFDATNPFADNQTLQTAIIKALDRCTVLDPACGSGAFPMGILQKMVHVLQKVDPENEHWRELQMEKALQETETAFHLADREARKQKLYEIEEAFDVHVNDPDYARKLFLIEDCIYGVDIQPIAAQISKLRFFISLVVEQKVDKSKDNFGIRPLPNLETKFVAANTLIGIEKPAKERNLFENQEINKLEAELKDVRHRIFSIKTPARKKALREKDQELREKMGDMLIADGWENKTARQMAGWDPYDQNTSSHFFDSDWMFGIKDGFDVVIGNPPYMRIQGIQKNNPKLAQYYKETFESATGRFDLYVLFTEKGLSFLKQAGILNYIMPHKWINSSFGQGLRNHSAKTRYISRLISFKDYQVFNASTYTSLVWFYKKKNSSLQYLELDQDLKDNNELKNWLDSVNESSFSPIDLESLSSGIWSLTNNKLGNILGEMNKQPWKTKDVFIYISQGVVSVGDDVFLIKGKINGKHLVGYSEKLKKEIIIESDIAKPLLKGEDIKKYCQLSASYYVIYPHYEKNGKTFPLEEKIFQDKFPLTYKYMHKFKAELTAKKIKYKTNPKCWYALHRSREKSMFEQKKIITPEISLGTNMTIDSHNLYHNTKCYSLVKNANIKESYEFWIAILNSSLMWFYLVSTGYVLRGGGFTFKTKYLESFPLPKLISLNEQLPFEILVNCIIYAKRKGYEKEASTCEQVIDGMVFQLYFRNHLKEKQIDILQFVEKDLAEVIQGSEFEQLPNSEKEDIINQLQARWSHPDSEVRNRIKLFADRSPDILKPILESR